VPFEDILVHTGRPVTAEQAGPKVDGKARLEDVPGTPFDCVLFLPAPAAEAERQGRRVRRPTLMFGPLDRAGEPVTLGAKANVLVTAQELTGPDGVLWQVDGDPQPLGKPGEDIIGSQASLVRVED
jgi:hypothetical protein